jgi:hypothetical protein
MNRHQEMKALQNSTREMTHPHQGPSFEVKGTMGKELGLLIRE